MWGAHARLGTRLALFGATVCCCCLSAVALSGCGVAGRAGAQTPARTVKISERDFKIKAPGRLHAGEVRLSVHNGGPDQHELIVVREGSKPLPLRSDGLTVDEDAVEKAKAGSLEPGQPGSVRELDLHLTPGRYVLLCNMSGHYLGGMHTQLVVR